MKCGLLVFVALTLYGCSEASIPTAANPPGATAPPTTTSGGLTWLWGFVVEPSGLCIEDAMVLVVRGQAVGQRVMQETPCDAWAYGGGFHFNDLAPNVAITLRASAPGWITEEATFVPGLGPQTTVSIVLEKR